MEGKVRSTKERKGEWGGTKAGRKKGGYKGRKRERVKLKMEGKVRSTKERKGEWGGTKAGRKKGEL